MLVGALSERGVEVERMDPRGVVARLPGRPERLELGLANLRRLLAQVDSREHPGVVGQWVEAAVAAARGQPEPPEAGQLMPRLGLPDADPEGVTWFAPLADDHLRAMLVLDQPTLVRFLRTLDLVEWRVGLVAARRRALENLDERSADVALLPVDDLPGVFEIATGDGYDAARLLILDRWVPGPLGALAVVPARDLLWVAPVDGPSSLELGAMLWSEAREALPEVPYPLSGELFWHVEGRLHHVPVVGDDAGGVRLVVPDALIEALQGAPRSD